MTFFAAGMTCKKSRKAPGGEPGALELYYVKLLDDFITTADSQLQRNGL